MDTVTEFISERPQLFLAALCACVIIIIGMYFNIFPKVEGAKSKKRAAKKSADSEDEEIDELIDSIHEKTK